VWVRSRARTPGRWGSGGTAAGQDVEQLQLAAGKSLERRLLSAAERREEALAHEALQPAPQPM